MDEPQTTKTLAAIQLFQEAFNRRDVEMIMALMTDDCIFENTYPPPNGARYVGQAAVRAFWEDFFISSPLARFVSEERFAAGLRGVERWTYHWVDRDGQAGSVRGVDIFRIRDGKIAEKLSYVKG